MIRPRYRLLLALALIVAACSGSDGGVEAETGEVAAAPTTTAVVPELPAVDDTIDGTFRGLPVGFTSEGFPFIGDPDAPVSVVEFSDYLCPFCARHTNDTTPTLLDEYAAAGDVNFIFRDFPLISIHPTAPNAHVAAQCVAEQSAAMFWEYHALLFATQREWADIAEPADYLAQRALSVGVDQGRFDECVVSGRMATLVAQRTEDGQREGFNGTPSFRLVVNESGESYDLVGALPIDRFRQTLDALIAGQDPSDLGTVAGDATRDGEPPVTFEVDPNDLGRYAGYEVGFTRDGFPFIGAADAAVSVVEFSDYACPFCSRHTSQTTPALLEEYGDSGDVQFVFRDYPLEELHPTAPQAHAASRCVAEQGAAYFWAFHDTLFFNQQAWAGLADPTDYLAATVGDIGADENLYTTCLASGRTAQKIADLVAEGAALGISGTPSFRFTDTASGDSYELVGAQPIEAFVAYIDAMVAGEAPPGTEPPELPSWATVDGLQPDPDRPGYTIAGDAFKGDPNAPVVVIEFSDFQCPACAIHALETQPAVDEALVDTGQIMFVYKHLPSASHPQAPVAAAAAECAGDQGRFWEMHDVLFAAVDQWAIDAPDAILEQLAADVDLDVGAFAACLAGRVAFQRVLDDVFEAEGIVDATPTFIVVYDGQGRRIVGTRAAEEFVTVLQEQVDLALGSGG